MAGCLEEAHIGINGLKSLIGMRAAQEVQILQEAPAGKINLHMGGPWLPASGGVLTMEKEHGPLGPNLSPSIYGLWNLELNHLEPQFPLLRNGHHDLYLTRLACRASETMQVR